MLYKREKGDTDIAMKLERLEMWSFGKFHNRSIELSDGINLFSAENEAGKSTIYAFIKSMLFGVERGRGRGAAKDEFHQYEPWRNPTQYSGMIRFESGGRHFQLERDFARKGKKARLFCLDDGEELSVEDGDLQALLMDLDSAGFENTVAVGQLKAKPGEELSAALKNYAANYYASGSGNMDLEAALSGLQKRKKEVEKSLKQAAQKRLQKREMAERAAEYTAKELDRIQREAAAGEEEIRRGKRLLDTYEQAREEKKKSKIPIKQGIIWLVVMILLFAVLPSSVRYYVAVIWAALGVLGGLWVMRPEKEQFQSEEEQAARRRIERLKWNREKLRTERRDRQVEYENIQEQIAEACTVSEEEKYLEKQGEALELAAARMQEVSGDVRKETGNRLAARAAEILGGITEGRYTKIFVDEGLDISIFDGVRKIPLHMLSRGTIEQIYFAVRMAASEILYEEAFPVLLDDTFAYYDNRRMEATLKWLAQQKKQVLLFSCQDREKEALDHMHLTYRDGWD